MKIEVNGKEDEWEQTEMYCVDCGMFGVWVGVYHDDYYEGATHLCTNCGCVWSFKGTNNASKNEGSDSTYYTIYNPVLLVLRSL